MGVDLTKITPKDLILGLYNGTSTGAGFTSMTFDVKANGADVLNKTFTSVVGGDDVLHQRRARSRRALGLWLDADPRYFALDHRGAGGGFDFGLLVGDPRRLRRRIVEQLRPGE